MYRLVLAEFEQFDVKPNIYSYNELRAATRDFHDDMKLGQGAYGAVFKVQNTTITRSDMLISCNNLGMLFEEH